MNLRPIDTARLNIQCDWILDDETQCQATATQTFVMPDSDSVDAITFFCDEHAATFQAPDNQPFNEGWVKVPNA